MQESMEQSFVVMGKGHASIISLSGSPQDLNKANCPFRKLTRLTRLKTAMEGYHKSGKTEKSKETGENSILKIGKFTVALSGKHPKRTEHPHGTYGRVKPCLVYDGEEYRWAVVKISNVLDAELQDSKNGVCLAWELQQEDGQKNKSCPKQPQEVCEEAQKRLPSMEAEAARKYNEIEDTQQPHGNLIDEAVQMSPSKKFTEYPNLPDINCALKLYTVMPWRGNKLNLDKKTPYLDRLKIWLGLCEQVNNLHKNSYYHGDVKPANATMDNNGVVHLVDYSGMREVAVERNPDLETQTTAYLPYSTPPSPIDMRESDRFAAVGSGFKPCGDVYECGNDSFKWSANWYIMTEKEIEAMCRDPEFNRLFAIFSGSSKQQLTLSHQEKISLQSILKSLNQVPTLLQGLNSSLDESLKHPNNEDPITLNLSGPEMVMLERYLPDPTYLEATEDRALIEKILRTKKETYESRLAENTQENFDLFCSKLNELSKIPITDLPRLEEGQLKPVHNEPSDIPITNLPRLNELPKISITDLQLAQMKSQLGPVHNEPLSIPITDLPRLNERSNIPIKVRSELESVGAEMQQFLDKSNIPWNRDANKTMLIARLAETTKATNLTDMVSTFIDALSTWLKVGTQAKALQNRYSFFPLLSNEKDTQTMRFITKAIQLFCLDNQCLDAWREFFNANERSDNSEINQAKNLIKECLDEDTKNIISATPVATHHSGPSQ